MSAMGFAAGRTTMSTSHCTSVRIGLLLFLGRVRAELPLRIHAPARWWSGWLLAARDSPTGSLCHWHSFVSVVAQRATMQLFAPTRWCGPCEGHDAVKILLSDWTSISTIKRRWLTSNIM